MPNASKGGGQAGVVAKDLPFEEAFKKLESIVDAMESDQLPLESVVTRLEEATRLIKTCQAKLDEAELKISRLEKDAGGEPVLKPVGESLVDDE